MLKTEMRNEKTRHIDQMESLDIVRLMNEENMNSVLAVQSSLPQIAKAVDAAAEALANGGKSTTYFSVVEYYLTFAIA